MVFYSDEGDNLFIYQVKINNYRGISSSVLNLANHTVLVGDNNTGKSTVLEAIDLVLGPERLFRKPIIDEHDFFAGQYLDTEGNPIHINIEIIVGDLSTDQLSNFQDYYEWWNTKDGNLLTGPSPELTNDPNFKPVLRLGFKGNYDNDEDDFVGETFFYSPMNEDNSYQKFGTKDKRLCGFLFLRTLRTGSRALSLERGSLLDIILKLKELKPQMWESILKQLRELEIVETDGAPVGSILSDIQKSLQLYIANDWGLSPHMKVTDLTRESLRKSLTVFIGTGAKDRQGKEYSAPFHHQGTGTINTLVLAMLSMIADLKQNVIFAMEEPEIAIPPHTQKRIVNAIRSKSAQAIFTSHSPYVLEEFDPTQIIVLTNKDGIMKGLPADISSITKKKNFRSEFRKKYCEALLARRVLIVEGRTEYDSIPAVAQRLHFLDPQKFYSLEALGVAIIDAEGDCNIVPLANLLKSLGKTTVGIYDSQLEQQATQIKNALDLPCESPEASFEKLILSQTSESALRRYLKKINEESRWLTHLGPMKNSDDDLIVVKAALLNFFESTKASGTASEMLSDCAINELPEYIINSILSIQKLVFPSVVTDKQEIVLATP